LIFGIIDDEEFKKLVETAKSIYYPKRTYKRVFKDSCLETGKVKDLQKFLEENGWDVKREDAIAVLKYIKKLE
jgi:hypothetical protein